MKRNYLKSPASCTISKTLLTLLLACCLASPSRAWVYPEHRKLMIAAITRLDPGRRNILDGIWAAARTGHEARLCAGVIEPGQGLKPQCLDFAAWCAIGGDHSVSAMDMTDIVLRSDWILNVAAITADLQMGLDKAKTRSSRVSEVRDSDVRLLRADPDYVSRAGKNNGHFMLALPGVNIRPESYFALCYREGTELNTVGTYAWYHQSALAMAARLHAENLTPEQRSALALAALADEAFAAHFLEDSFTSGHVAGIWGDAAKRKGTHDYYNEAGLTVTTWQDKKMVLMGDATMREDDIGWASAAVCKSLTQVLDAVSGVTSFDPAFYSAASAPAVPDTFNVSRAKVMPVHPLDPGVKTLCDSVLVETPIPGLKAGIGEMPRFRAEIGPFVGLSAASGSYYLNRGFFSYQDYDGFCGGLELGFRAGLGMEGVLNESGDGLVFIEGGARIDIASTMRFDYNSVPEMHLLGDITAAIPSRDAYYVRLRLPFYLIPGDLIILAPLLAVVSPKAMQQVVATAGNGGLIPWQTGLPTAIGRFQFVLGREVAITMYGSSGGPDPYLVTLKRSGDPNVPDDQGCYSMYTTRFEFPIVEYRPFRTYSSRQTGSLVFQFAAGFDVPGKRTTIVAPEGYDMPDKHTILYAGLRLVFDYRYYFSGKKK